MEKRPFHQYDVAYDVPNGEIYVTLPATQRMKSGVLDDCVERSVAIAIDCTLLCFCSCALEKRNFSVAGGISLICFTD